MARVEASGRWRASCVRSPAHSLHPTTTKGRSAQTLVEARPERASGWYAGQVSYQPVEHHGVVGDLHRVALVAMDGSIDFMCFPQFDSPTIFAALLDERQGGRFQIAPALGSVGRRQLYLPDSNVLLTRFLSNEGVAEISDFM